MSIVYAVDPSLSVAEYASVLAETTMGRKRPLANLERIERMIAGANLIVTAREAGVVLGFARCITDFAWIAYCSELAVRESAQKRGIGAGIMARVQEHLGPGIALLLVSEPDAVGFYQRIGMAPQDRVFFRPRADSS
jgi:GNAT superfamily N-acetyltransferase